MGHVMPDWIFLDCVNLYPFVFSNNDMPAITSPV